MAVDMRNNARRDGSPGVRPAGSRRRSAQYLGRVLTTQRAGEETRIAPTMVSVGALDSIPGAPRRTMEVAGRACAEADVEPVLPVARGPTGVAALRMLREEGAGYMMVRRTGSVVDATAGHAAGTRDSVPAVTMGPGGGAGRLAVIVPRRDAGKREGAPPSPPPPRRSPPARRGLT